MLVRSEGGSQGLSVLQHVGHPQLQTNGFCRDFLCLCTKAGEPTWQRGQPLRLLMFCLVSSERHRLTRCTADTGRFTGVTSASEVDLWGPTVQFFLRPMSRFIDPRGQPITVQSQQDCGSLSDSPASVGLKHAETFHVYTGPRPLVCGRRGNDGFFRKRFWKFFRWFLKCLWRRPQRVLQKVVQKVLQMLRV